MMVYVLYVCVYVYMYVCAGVRRESAEEGDSLLRRTRNLFCKMEYYYYYRGTDTCMRAVSTAQSRGRLGRGRRLSGHTSSTQILRSIYARTYERMFLKDCHMPERRHSNN